MRSPAGSLLALARRAGGKPELVQLPGSPPQPVEAASMLFGQVSATGAGPHCTPCERCCASHLQAAPPCAACRRSLLQMLAEGAARPHLCLWCSAAACHAVRRPWPQLLLRLPRHSRRWCPHLQGAHRPELCGCGRSGDWHQRRSRGRGQHGRRRHHGCCPGQASRDGEGSSGHEHPCIRWCQPCDRRLQVCSAHDGRSEVAQVLRHPATQVCGGLNAV